MFMIREKIERAIREVAEMECYLWGEHDPQVVESFGVLAAEFVMHRLDGKSLSESRRLALIDVDEENEQDRIFATLMDEFIANLTIGAR
jgi:hypothetical protein